MIDPFRLKPNISPTYFGGKSGAGTYHKIINQIPPHDTFISGFLGKCGILRHKRPAKYNIGVDIDKSVIDFWESDGRLQMVNDSFMETFEIFKPDAGVTFIYLDPPYKKDTRKSRRNHYKFEMGHDDHVKLLNLIVKFKCMVAISAYKNELYDEYLKGWRRIDFQSNTHQGPAIESLYMNYSKPTDLHDFRYIGNDFREREKYKRKRNSMLRKIKEMQPLERNYLFSTLKSKFNL